ncbi:MAG TPA: uroporphyrinogen decarboxylase family protein [candidate division Zixibacteria bacterium]|nr:uroporphyrinogen decarboxylase family protein [candidate division Zixibacteria bacterium]
MNSRQRFKETMAYGQPDRVPYFEEGIKEEVLRNWRVEGMAADVAFSTLFHSDKQEELAPDVEPIPFPKTWPATRSELRILRERLDPNDPERLPAEWPKRVKSWRNRDHVLMVRVNRGLFQTLGITDWRRFSEVIYLLKDDPEFVREAMGIQSEFVVAMLKRILAEVEVDAAIFSEPIGGNSGPLISPRMYEEFALDSYEPILSTLREHGIETIIFRTYANSRILIPSILKRGFNCLWACEVEVKSMDYRDIRKEYGKDLRLIGGIDLDSLLDGRDSIRRELEEKVPALLAQGGYVPLADGRVRKDVPYERYIYYRQLLQSLITGATG